MVPLSVRILRRRDRRSYNRLARLAYAQAQGFSAEEHAIVWSPLDEAFYQFGVFSGDELVANMRLEWLRQVKDFKGRLKYDPSPEEVPCAYLNIAATDPEWQGRGLNGLLRYFCLKVVSHWPVRYVFGSMIPDSPRVRTMERMGYQFWQSGSPWKTGFISPHLPLIARLDLECNAGRAIEVLTAECSDLLKVVRIDFSPEAIRMRTPQEINAIFTDYKKFFGDLESRRTD